MNRLVKTAALAAFLAMAGSFPVPAAERSVWDGVYSAAQAEQGAEVYASRCALCHSETMEGGPGAPPLTGPVFMFNWNGMSLAAFLGYMRATMPPGETGSLSDQEYVDVLAAILKVNGFPPGDTGGLPTDVSGLQSIMIKREK